jgi:hypothetical protein
MDQAVAFAELAQVGALVAFHHDPAHDDDTLDTLFAELEARLDSRVAIMPAHEGTTLAVGRLARR